MAKALRVNEQIRIPKVLLIDHENTHRGVIHTADALKMARELGLDLVEVSPNEKPPVCRLMDYGKHKYQQKKRQKQSAGPQVTLKEIRLRPKTDDNDRAIKVKHAIEFIEKGHKVQFTMLFRGREKFNKDFAMEKFQQIIDTLGEQVKILRAPTFEGRRMVMVVAPAK